MYGAIETILSYRDNRNKGAVSVALGLGLLAFGEFLGWYSFVFPESILYSISMTIKIAGLVALFIPVSKVPLKRIKFDDDLDKIRNRLKNLELSNSFIFLVYTKISIVSYIDLRKIIQRNGRV